MVPRRVEHNHADRAFNNLLDKQYSVALSYFRDWFDQHKMIQDNHLAAALWLNDEYGAACEQWVNEIERFHMKPREITHTDGAGGVIAPAFLWWASAHEQMIGFEPPALKELKSRWKTKYTQRSIWPGAIANYILGGIDEGALVKIVVTTMPEILIDRTLLEAWFYISASYLKAGDESKYIEYLQKTVSINPAGLQMEWFLARYELDRLGQTIAHKT